MKRIFFIAIIISIVIATIFMIQQITTQKTAFSSQNPQEDYNRAILLSNDGRADEAITILEKIIQENPGSGIAADCHFELAGIYGFMKDDSDRMLQAYQTVARDYAGTMQGVRAEASLIDCKYRKDSVPLDTWLQKKNELLVKYGGVSIYDIITAGDEGGGSSDEDGKLWHKIHSISPEYKNVIAAEYTDIAYHLIGTEDERPDDSLRMHLFVRTYFPRYCANWKQINCIRNIIIEKKGINRSTFHLEGAPPSIRLIAPHEGQTIGDSRPKIEVELSQGSIAEYQVDLSKLVFTLDGQDVTDEMTVRSNINKSAEVGPIFEKIRLRYRPGNPLNSGLHTMYVKAMDVVEHTSEKTWSFTVK